MMIVLGRGAGLLGMVQRSSINRMSVVVVVVVLVQLLL